MIECIETRGSGAIRYFGYRLIRQDGRLYAPLLGGFMMLWLLFAIAISAGTHRHLQMGQLHPNASGVDGHPLHTTVSADVDDGRDWAEWLICVQQDTQLQNPSYL